MLRELAALTFREVVNAEGDVVDGVSTYFICDARSKVATRGNQLMGKGVEQVRLPAAAAGAGAAERLGQAVCRRQSGRRRLRVALRSRGERGERGGHAE